jgi:hypothetical protein
MKYSRPTVSLTESLLAWVKSHDWGTDAFVDTSSDGELRIYGLTDAKVSLDGIYSADTIDFPVSRFGHKLIREWAGY